MNEAYNNKEQIQEMADFRLNQHKKQMAEGNPFSFDIEIGERLFNVSYIQDEQGIWKFQDYKEVK